MFLNSKGNSFSRDPSCRQKSTSFNNISWDPWKGTGKEDRKGLEFDRILLVGNFQNGLVWSDLSPGFPKIKGQRRFSQALTLASSLLPGRKCRLWSSKEADRSLLGETLLLFQWLQSFLRLIVVMGRKNTSVAFFLGLDHTVPKNAKLSWSPSANGQPDLFWN